MGLPLGKGGTESLVPAVFAAHALLGKVPGPGPGASFLATAVLRISAVYILNTLETPWLRPAFYSACAPQET